MNKKSIMLNQLGRLSALFSIFCFSLVLVSCEEDGTPQSDGGPDTDSGIGEQYYEGQASLKYRRNQPFIDEETCVHVRLDLDGSITYRFDDEECTGVLTFDSEFVSSDEKFRVTRTGEINWSPVEGGLVEGLNGVPLDKPQVSIDRSAVMEGVEIKSMKDPLNPDADWIDMVPIIVGGEWSGFITFSFNDAVSADGAVISLKLPDDPDEFIWSLTLRATVDPQ
jgi:hypothetical protein